MSGRPPASVVACSSKSQCSVIPASSATLRSASSPHLPRTCELRSAVERSLVRAPVIDVATPVPEKGHLSFRVAKNLASADWERRYLSELLPAHDGNVSRAARAAKMNRSHLSELVRRHGLSSVAANHGDDVSPSDD